MWVYAIIVLFEFRFLDIWQINLYTEGLDSPPLIAWITTVMWNKIVIKFGLKTYLGTLSPLLCLMFIVFLCFNKSIGLSHRLVSQKKKKKTKNKKQITFTLLSLGCETWNLSETWEPLSISWDKISFGWKCGEDTILWTYGLRRLFFFFNHLGSKNTNFSVGLCYILELVSLKYRIWKKPGEFA